jgi:small subunit ribosomal protein S16
MGTKKKPFYRVIVADSRMSRDGRFIENIGYYDPLADPSRIEIDGEKALAWIKKGAQPTNTVRVLLKKCGILPRLSPPEAKGADTKK